MKRLFALMAACVLAMSGVSAFAEEPMTAEAWSALADEVYDVDPLLAAAYYEKAGELGDPWAYKSAGMIHRYDDINESGVAQCISCLERGAEMGLFLCAMELAFIYEEGIVDADGTVWLEPDLAESFRWYEQVLELHPTHTYALAMVGYFYSGYGDVVPVDYEKAVEYYYEAARRSGVGADFACRQLGLMYRDGIYFRSIPYMAAFYFMRAMRHASTTEEYDVAKALYDELNIDDERVEARYEVLDDIFWLIRP